MALSDELAYGTYTLTETATGAAYVLDETPHKIVIEEHEKVVELRLENHKKQGKIAIVKVDGESKAPLEGVVFEVFDADGKLRENADVTLVAQAAQIAADGALGKPGGVADSALRDAHRTVCVRNVHQNEVKQPAGNRGVQRRQMLVFRHVVHCVKSFLFCFWVCKKDSKKPPLLLKQERFAVSSILLLVFRPFCQRNVEHPPVIALGLQFTLCYQCLERNRAGLFGPLRCYQRPDVFVPQNGRDGNNAIALIHQHKVHQKPRGSAVSVCKGVDVHQPPVGKGRKKNRMNPTFLRVQFFYKNFHQRRHFFGRRGHIFCAGDDYLMVAVLPSRHFIYAAVKQVMQFLYHPLDVYYLAPTGDSEHIVVGFRVSAGLVKIADGLAAYGDAIFQQHLRFGECEGVALQRIAGIGGADFVILVKLTHFVCRKRTPGGNLLPVFIYSSQQCRKFHAGSSLPNVRLAFFCVSIVYRFYGIKAM